MRELKASVFRLDEDFSCFKVGEIIWNGEKIPVEPVGIRDLQEIASRPYWISPPPRRHGVESRKELRSLDPQSAHKILIAAHRRE
jgi:hypothetical protein